MDEKNLMTETEDKMKIIVEDYKKDLASMKAGRATPLLLEKVTVEYYGVPTPINQVASIGITPPRTIVIQPWDKKLLGAIEKALQKADLGAMPSNDGNVVRLTIPPLSGERRQELIKVIRKECEMRKVMVRNIRRDAIDQVKEAEKAKEISEDESRRLQDKIQKLTDKYVEMIDNITSVKEKEVMEV